MDTNAPNDILGSDLFSYIILYLRLYLGLVSLGPGKGLLVRQRHHLLNRCREVFTRLTVFLESRQAFAYILWIPGEEEGDGVAIIPRVVDDSMQVGFIRVVGHA